MDRIFENVLVASFQGGILIGVILLLRPLLKKAPKKYICLLWMLAGLRLLIPVQIPSPVSLQPVPRTQWTAQEPAAQGQSSQQLAQPPAAPSQEDFLPDSQEILEEPLPEELAAPQPGADLPPAAPGNIHWLTVAAWVWVTGVGVVGLYTLISYLNLRKRLRWADRIREGLYVSDSIETAFILGYIHPKIYIPLGMNRENCRYILAHEQTHLEKGDHWVKLIGFLTLGLHWFNPLVWLGYWLLCKDIELACDERVVQFMDLEERKRYSAALIACSTKREHYAACPVAFGEVSVKDRIRRVLQYKRPSFWISLLALIAVVTVGVCFLTSPKKEEPGQPQLEQIAVSNVEQLLAAIGPEREIVLAEGTYNLSASPLYGKATGSDYASWTPVADSYQLKIHDVENLTIRGSGQLTTEVVTDPRNVDVLELASCKNVTLRDFTAGHTEMPEPCGGAVLSLESSEGIVMERLGLYGCGMIGLEAVGSQNIRLSDCEIYDCSVEAVSLEDCDGVTLSGSRLYNIGSQRIGSQQKEGYTYLAVSGSQEVLVENCILSDSNLCHLVSILTAWERESQVTFRGNLVEKNRFILSAFQQNDGVTLCWEENKLTDNVVNMWYLGSGVAVDQKGELLTQEKLDSMYDTGMEKKEIGGQPRLEVRVNTVDEFLAAIGPNREIVVEAAELDLTQATGYGTVSGDYYTWRDHFDGPELLIQKVDNLVIRGATGDRTAHNIYTTPRYANVLDFEYCSNIWLADFTAGHTQAPGECAGGVIRFASSHHMTVSNCGLFGCGILGVDADYAQDITVENCDIYDCSLGGVRMLDCSNIVLDNNTFRNIGGDHLIYLDGCNNAMVDGERVIPAGEGISHYDLASPE